MVKKEKIIMNFLILVCARTLIDIHITQFIIIHYRIRSVGGQISSYNIFVESEPQKWVLAWMGRKRE